MSASVNICTPYAQVAAFCEILNPKNRFPFMGFWDSPFFLENQADTITTGKAIRFCRKPVLENFDDCSLIHPVRCRRVGVAS
jgi:hypothetical protein